MEVIAGFYLCTLKLSILKSPPGKRHVWMSIGKLKFFCTFHRLKDVYPLYAIIKFLPGNSGNTVNDYFN